MGWLAYLGLGLLWSWFITTFITSLGYHRYFSHGHFKAPVWFEYVILILAPFGGVPSLFSWAATHRLHHKHADTELDPHNPRRIGIWNTFMGKFDVVGQFPTRMIVDLMRNPRVKWFHKHSGKIHKSISLLALIFLPFPAFIAFIVMPYLYGYFAFGMLNILCHTENGARNHWVVNVLITGEGFHRVHHDDNRKVRYHKYDIVGYVAEKLFTPVN
jgi:stearoyl-CoA desaturase (delta-9 desaturase)